MDYLWSDGFRIVSILKPVVTVAVLGSVPSHTTKPTQTSAPSANCVTGDNLNHPRAYPNIVHMSLINDMWDVFCEENMRYTLTCAFSYAAYSLAIAYSRSIALASYESTSFSGETRHMHCNQKWCKSLRSFKAAATYLARDE